MQAGKKPGVGGMTGGPGGPPSVASGVLGTA